MVAQPPSCFRLRVLDNADLGSPQHAAVKLESLALSVKDGAILLAGLRRHESRLVLVGVELLALDARVESLHAVLLEGLHEDGLGHLKAIVQVDEVLVARLQLLGGNVGKGAVKVVDAVHEVLGETLDGEVLRSLHLSLRLVLQVAEVGDAVLELVLYD